MYARVLTINFVILPIWWAASEGPIAAVCQVQYFWSSMLFMHRLRIWHQDSNIPWRMPARSSCRKISYHAHYPWRLWWQRLSPSRFCLRSREWPRTDQVANEMNTTFSWQNDPFYFVRYATKPSSLSLGSIATPFNSVSLKLKTVRAWIEIYSPVYPGHV